MTPFCDQYCQPLLPCGHSHTCHIAWYDAFRASLGLPRLDDNHPTVRGFRRTHQGAQQ